MTSNTQNWVSMFLYLGAFIAIFYIFLILPRKKEEKKHKALLEELKRGDKVVSIGGIKGTVARITEETVIVKVSDNGEIELIKKAIAYRIED